MAEPMVSLDPASVIDAQGNLWDFEDYWLNQLDRYGKEAADVALAAAYERAAVTPAMSVVEGKVQKSGYYASQMKVFTGSPIVAIQNDTEYAEYLESSTEKMEGTQPVQGAAEAGQASLAGDIEAVASEMGGVVETQEQGLETPGATETGWNIGGGGSEGSDVGAGDTQGFAGNAMTDFGEMAGDTEHGIAAAFEGAEEVASLGESVAVDVVEIALI